jgi:hypothetical protein
LAVAHLLWSSPSRSKQVIPASRLQAAPCTPGTGDVDGDGLLATDDAVCAFAVFLEGEQLPSGCDAPDYACEIGAADVNCDGSVTPGDARAIEARRAAGLFPSDCFAQSAPAPSAPPYQIALVQEVVDDGGTTRLRVTLAVQDATDLDAFGARLAFPAGEIAFQRAQAGNLTAAWFGVDGRPAGAGSVLFGGFEPGVTAPPGPGNVCHLYFDFFGAPQVVAGLSLSGLVDDFVGASVVGTVTAAPGPPGSSTRLHQNRPNPFNPVTRIPYDVAGPATESVRLAIYDVRGALVRVLVDAERAPGSYVAVWDGRTGDGVEASSGIYFCSMRAGGYTASRRMVLLK